MTNSERRGPYNQVFLMMMIEIFLKNPSTSPKEMESCGESVELNLSEEEMVAISMFEVLL